MTLPGTDESKSKLGAFWWAFTLRGGYALLFSALMFYAGTLFGTIFFDPIMLVLMAMLLGFYVLGNGVLLGVTTVFAAEHRDTIWPVLLSESTFALGLGIYIAFSLLLSGDSLALLAGLHAVGTGAFLLALTSRLRGDKPYALLLGFAGVASVLVGVLFLLHRNLNTKQLTHWLGSFELFYGAVTLIFANELHRRRAAALRVA